MGHSVVLFVICLLAATFSSRGFAETEWFEFTARECEKHLRDTTRPPRHVNTKAAGAVSWLTATHPCVTSVLEDQDGMDVARRFDVLFACSGFALPPASQWNGPKTPILQHYDRVATFGLGRQGLGRRLLRRIPEYAVRAQADFPIDEKVVYVASLLTRSFALLDAVNRGDFQNNRIQLNMEANQGVPKQAVTLDLSQTFFPEERKVLRELAKEIGEDGVRNRIVRLVENQLDEIISEQQRLCRDLQVCESADEFRRLARIYRLGADAATPVTPAGETPKTGKPATADLSFEDAIENFFMSVPAAEFGDVEARLVEIYRALHAALKVLNGSLAHFHRWRALEPQMTGWKHEFDGTLDSIDRLSEVMDDFNAQTLQAMKRFQQGETAIQRLGHWLDKTTSQVTKLTKDEKRLAKLSVNDQGLLKSIVLLTPQFSVLMEQASESIRLHRARLVSRMETSSSIGLLVGGVLKKRLGEDPSASTINAEFEEIGTALELLNEGSGRGR